MFLTALNLWIVLNVVLGDNVNDTTGASGFRYADSGNPINVTESCNEKSPCIGKCCPANQILVSNISDNNLLCVDNSKLTLTYNLTNLGDYSGFEFYKNNIMQNIVKSKKKMEEFIQIYNDDFRNQNNFMNINPYFQPPANKIYLLENGSAVIRRFNYLKQWINVFPPDKLCLEHQISLKNGTVSKQELVIRALVTSDGDGDYETDDTRTKNTILAVGLLVSCVYLAMVLATYALLRQLRNLAGLILMAYVATLTTTYILKATQVFVTNYGYLNKETCIWLGLLANYTVVSSFAWMNVMSFDIWWSMRGFRKLRQINRRGVLVKLGSYGLYGWGAPLLLTIFTIVVENMDLSHLPDFVKSQYSDPNSCFMGELEESLLYLNAPILIMTCINIALFLMTAYNIWRIKRAVSHHGTGDSRRNEKDEARFGIYMKLSLVMGINWILEAASTFYNPKSKWWYGSDVFNSLSGLLIFIIFICKRSIILLLCKRLSIGQKLIRKWQPVDSKDTASTRSNGRYSKRKKMLDSVTDASDIYDTEKSIKSSLCA